MLSNHFCMDILPSVGNFSCNAANDVDGTCLLQREKKWSDLVNGAIFLRTKALSHGQMDFFWAFLFPNSLSIFKCLEEKSFLSSIEWKCWPDSWTPSLMKKQLNNGTKFIGSWSCWRGCYKWMGPSCQNHPISKWFFHIVKRWGSFWYRVNSFNSVTFQLIKCLKCCRAVGSSAKNKITHLAITALFVLSLICEFRIFGFSSCRLNIICTFGEMSHHF